MSPLPDGQDDSDPSALARREAAALARHDYQRAIADLTRACELARSHAYRSNKQPELALADLEQAIGLNRAKSGQIWPGALRREIAIRHGQSFKRLSDRRLGVLGRNAFTGRRSALAV